MRGDIKLERIVLRQREACDAQPRANRHPNAERRQQHVAAADQQRGQLDVDRAPSPVAAAARATRLAAALVVAAARHKAAHTIVDTMCERIEVSSLHDERRRQK